MGFERPNHGYLGGWAEQGVLLLNACLTVRKAEANSHKDKGGCMYTLTILIFHGFVCFCPFVHRSS